MTATDADVTAHIARGKRDTLVLLLKGPHRDQEESTANAIQAAHLRHLVGLIKDRKLLVNGPIAVDSELRGISFYAGDVAEVRALVEADPAIVAGRLRCELHPWFGIPGETLA